MGRILLSAEWTNLLVVNFETDKNYLQQYLPAGTELNDWNGKYLMSLVGFQFSKTNLLGIPSPFFRSFPEINLRFYVKRKISSGWRKGVVFIKEICPYSLAGLMAGWLYKENFMRLPMKSETKTRSDENRIEYDWKINGEWNYLKAGAAKLPADYTPYSSEYFILNHYFGYTRINDSTSKEFEVIHRPWQIHPVISFDMKLDAEKIYGKRAAVFLSQPPHSVFLMDGSETKVTWPVKI